MTPVALVVGPPEHGVVRHARRLADAAGWPVATRVEDVPTRGWVVLDVTDRLWGATADVSGPALASALDRLRSRGSRVAVALHDVPFTGDGPVAARRAAVYRGIMQRSDAVFVCSDVERERVDALGGLHVPVAVLPLPVGPRRPTPVGAPARRPESVTVLGFVYPGKGHAEVLAAMAGLPRGVALVCAGRASDGHEDLLDELRAGDRAVHVTGFVPDATLVEVLQGPTVPVAPNRVVSASASLTTWWEHGRRPLLPDVAYTQEVATDATARTYDDDLAGALRAAFDDPGSTWLAPGVQAGPSVAQVAAARDAWLARWSG